MSKRANGFELPTGASHIAYFRTDGGSQILYTEEYVNNLQQKVEQLENIRKEAIEWVINHKNELHHSFDEPDWDYLLYGNADDLLNILNKGSEDNEDN